MKNGRSNSAGMGTTEYLVLIGLAIVLLITIFWNSLIHTIVNKVGSVEDAIAMKKSSGSGASSEAKGDEKESETKSLGGGDSGGISYGHSADASSGSVTYR